MIIERKTRDINRYLTHLTVGDTYFIGLPLNESSTARIIQLGFSMPFILGERLLPSGHLGPASRRNANGYEVVHRDQEMETAYRQISWTYTQYHGDQRIEVTEVKDVPYRRYPRTQIAPYSIELSVSTRADGTAFVVAGPFRYSKATNDSSTNTANMFYEQFGGFEILDASFEASAQIPLHRLNWRLLPVGNLPWESTKTMLAGVIEKSRGRSRQVIEARFNAISKYTPEFVAIGIGGFDDYAAFIFPQLDLCILESRYTNNATYVLSSSNWETVSQMTKAQILHASAHRIRLIHTRSWFEELASLFSGLA